MALKVRKNKSPEIPNDCPLDACLSAIGGAWTTNIVWYLRGGPRRFSELRYDIPGISAKMLTTRLRDMERKYIVDRAVLPTSPPSVEYSLTDLGHELMPVIESIAEVGHKLKMRAAANIKKNQKPAPAEATASAPSVHAS